MKLSIIADHFGLNQRISADEYYLKADHFITNLIEGKTQPFLPEYLFSHRLESYEKINELILLKMKSCLKVKKTNIFNKIKVIDDITLKEHIIPFVFEMVNLNKKINAYFPFISEKKYEKNIVADKPTLVKYWYGYSDLNKSMMSQLAEQLFLSPKMEVLLEGYFKDIFSGKYELNRTFINIINNLNLYNKNLIPFIGAIMNKTYSSGDKFIPDFMPKEYRLIKTFVEKVKDINQVYKMFPETNSELIENLVISLINQLTEITEEIVKIDDLSILEGFIKTNASEIKKLIGYLKNKESYALLYKKILLGCNLILSKFETLINTDLDTYLEILTLMISIYHNDVERIKSVTKNAQVAFRTASNDHQFIEHLSEYFITHLNSEMSDISKRKVLLLSELIKDISNKAIFTTKYIFGASKRIIYGKNYEIEKQIINKFKFFLSDSSINKLVQMTKDKDNAITHLEKYHAKHADSKHLNVMTFSCGTWDIPLNDEYLKNDAINKLPLKFSNEITKFNNHYIFENDNKKKLLWYLLKGSIEMEVNGKDMTFLPLQAITIMYIAEGESNYENMINKINSLMHVVDNELGDKIIGSLIEGNLLYKDGNNITLMVSNTTQDNFITIFNKNTNYTRLEEDVMEHEKVLSVEETIPSIVISHIKKGIVNMDDIYQVTKNDIADFYELDQDAFKNVIEHMVKRDFVTRDGMNLKLFI